MAKIRLKRIANKVAEPGRKGTTVLFEREHDVLTLAEAAEYLRISRGFLYRLAREQTVPCARLGTRRLFSRATLAKWLDERMETKNETTRGTR